MKKPLTLKILLVFSLLLSVAKLSAQVHIGADVAPQPFSVLELYAKYKTDPVDTYGGLRMPQLDTVQRNALSRTYGTDPAFFGLTIYNTNNNCLEYWNSTKWISLCLGTANIWLEGEPCDYDPSTPVIDGAPCTYTPVEVPPCEIPNPYQVYLVAGFAYANLVVTDEFTSAFTVIFDENNSALPRIAVVRVTNNCTGEFKDFPFIQAGGICTGGDAFSVSSNSTVLCGTNGAVIAWVTNPQVGMKYVWGLNGVPVHTGNYYEIRRPGKYTVYAGLLGCTDPEPQEIIITQTSGTSPNAPYVIASNSGMICSNGSVTLTAYNVTYPVQWFQNGKMYTGTYSDGTAGPVSANPLIVSTASAAGEWFAVQIDAPCGSRMSSIVNLVYVDIPSLPTPCAKINGTSIDNTPPPVICRNGTLELEICNHGAYPPGTVYEWFANGVSIWHPTTSPIIYTTPLNLGTTTLSVQASNNSGGCPSTAISAVIAVIHDAPPPTMINNGADRAAICGSSPAILLALNTSGAEYEWFRNDITTCQFITGVVYDKMPSGIFRYDADTVACYAVRYKDANECWSPLSPSIRVIQSAVISLVWRTAPPDTARFNTQATYEVTGSPTPESYAWMWSSLTSPAPSPSAISSFVPVPPAHDAISVGYRNVEDTVMIRVEATNLCGTVPLQKKVYVQPGCIPITAVNLEPSGTVIRNLDNNDVPLPGHLITNFVATALNGSPATSYKWYVGGVEQIGFTSNTFTFNTPTTPGNYAIFAAAINGCSAANSATTIVRVEPCATANSANYRISGKTCYDVAMTEYGRYDECKPLAGRHDDFSLTKSFNYIFSSPTSSSFSNVTFEVRDHASPNNLLATTDPITWSGTTATITFRSDINAFATGFSKNDPRGKLTIIATFFVGAACQQVALDVFVQDCLCACQVRSSAAGAVMTFMCYNLGVSANAKSLTPTQQQAYTAAIDNYGYLYQWVRNTDGHQIRTPNPGVVGGPWSALNAAGQPSTSLFIFNQVYYPPTDWRTPQAAAVTNPWNSGNATTPSKGVGDPCPTGWRVPTNTELAIIINTSLNTRSAWQSGNTPGYLFRPVGASSAEWTLFMPAAGFRSVTGGSPVLVGTRGTYWSSIGFGVNAISLDLSSSGPYMTDAGSPFARAHGFSIRCVAE